MSRVRKRRTALVLGAGSYVLGDAYGHGVVLPTLLDEARAGTLDRILLGVRTFRGDDYHRRLATLGRELQLEPRIEEQLLSDPGELARLPTDEMLAFVAVPDPHHAPWIEPLLRAGVPTWVVKPLAGDGATAQRLAELSTGQDTPLWVDYHKRFDPTNQKIAALVQGGELGRLLTYSVQYTQPWRLPLEGLAAWSRDVGVFQYIGCHYVDQLLWLHPHAHVRRASATGLPGRLAAVGGPRHDVVHAVLDLAQPTGTTDLRADLVIGWSDPDGSPAKSHQRVELLFEAGRVVCDQKARGFELWTDDRFHEVNPYFLQVLPDPELRRPRVCGYGPESLRAFLRSWDDAERRASRELPWAQNAWRTDQVLDGVAASMSAGGAWIPGN